MLPLLQLGDEPVHQLKKPPTKTLIFQFYTNYLCERLFIIKVIKSTTLK